MMDLKSRRRNNRHLPVWMALLRNRVRELEVQRDWESADARQQGAGKWNFLVGGGKMTGFVRALRAISVDERV